MALGPVKPSEGQRVVSGNEWPASDRHATNCGITNRPGTFPQSPREPSPTYKSWDSRRLLASLEPALALKKKKSSSAFFFFWSFWRVQSPSDGLCCWVCVPSLFCRPEELGSSVADCLQALQMEAGWSLTTQGKPIKGFRGKQAGPTGSSLCCTATYLSHPRSAAFSLRF